MAGRKRSRFQRSRGDGAGRRAHGDQRRAGARSVSQRRDQRSRTCSRRRSAIAFGPSGRRHAERRGEESAAARRHRGGHVARRPARSEDRERACDHGGQCPWSGSRKLEPGGPRVRRSEAVRPARGRLHQERGSGGARRGPESGRAGRGRSGSADASARIAAIERASRAAWRRDMAAGGNSGRWLRRGNRIVLFGV